MIGAITTAIQNPVAPVVVTVTGGTLYTSGSYNYRLFTANGTLGVSGGTLTYDCLVVAGGGGGGGGNTNFGGGGVRRVWAYGIPLNNEFLGIHVC